MTPRPLASLVASRPTTAALLRAFAPWFERWATSCADRCAARPGGVVDWVNAGLAAINIVGLSMERRRDLGDLFLKPVADLLDTWFESEQTV